MGIVNILSELCHHDSTAFILRLLRHRFVERKHSPHI